MGIFTEDKSNLLLFITNVIFAIIFIVGTGIVVGTGSTITNPQYNWVVYLFYGDAVLAILSGFMVLLGSSKKLSVVLCFSTFLNIIVIAFFCAIFWALYYILSFINIDSYCTNPNSSQCTLQYNGYRAMLAGAVVVFCAQILFICAVCVRCNAVRKEK